MLSLSLFALAVQLWAQSQAVSAQGTSAVCTSNYDWMFNSKNQSPCLIASYLLAPCASGSLSYVFPLTSGEHYATPTSLSGSANPCRCNTVFYSMISACATCQGQGNFVPTWSDYNEFCSPVYIQQYPEDIVSGTSVPAWAYIDVTNGTFDPISAQALAAQDPPESTGSVSSPTSGTVLSTSARASATATGAPQSGNDDPDVDSSPSPAKKSTNIGAIVGGVVGGVVAVVGIALALFFWLRHRRNAARNAPTGPLDLTAGEYGQFLEKPPVSAAAFPPPSPSSPPPPASPNPKIYNPDDPSTFPRSVDDQGASQGSATYVDAYQAQAPAVPYGYPAEGPYQPVATSPANPIYKGVPEL
ncbi:hypothetical protein C8Q79DRAFT_366009 [Trametes meyenii]|nr:hypothetical protein C8Q79DRAFT_366009 [Trametes meyenii]